MFEGTCGRCGTLNCFHTLESTKCKQVVGNKICQGFPVKIFEVHTTLTGLQNAMLERLANPKKTYPVLKFRPIEEWTTAPGKLIEVFPRADGDPATDSDREKFPTLAKLLNW